MSPPFPLLLGVVLLFVQQQFDATLPGEVSATTFAPFALLITCPWLATRWVRARISHDVLWRGVVTRSTRIWIGAPAALTPIVYAVLLFAGGLTEVIAQIPTRSYFVEHALLLAPLVTMDVSTRLGEARTEKLIERAGPFLDTRPAASLLGRALERMTALSGPIGPRRIAMTLFVVLPVLGFAAATDLAFVDERLEAFFGTTSAGTSTGLSIAVLSLCAVLPLCFRWTMPTSTRLPPEHVQSIRETARALDFAPDRILVLDTDRRVFNAALVGPLRWPRYLVLTDGILALLDSLALRAVVAHEIGHARARHPGLLLLVAVGVPVLLLQPISSIDFASMQPTALALGTVVVAAGALTMMRRLFHRFEFEADQQSVEALGGAGPCIRALQRVGELTPGHHDRASFRHPSEAQRVRHLESWATDPEYRRRDQRAGRRVRLAIFGAAAFAAVACVSAHVATWPFDRAVYAFYTGDFGRAERLFATLEPAVPQFSERELQRMRESSSAATELVGPGGPGQWRALSPTLARAGWQRGLDELGRADAAAARRWFALSLVDADNSPVERSMYRFCDAVAEKDLERSRRLYGHLTTLPLDVEVRELLGRVRP